MARHGAHAGLRSQWRKLSDPGPATARLSGIPRRRLDTPWLAAHRETLEQCAAAPLAFSGVAAATLHVLGFSPEQGEMLFLLLRLPGAAAHALEQEKSWARFPFFGSGLTLTDDPGPVAPVSVEQ